MIYNPTRLSSVAGSTFPKYPTTRVGRFRVDYSAMFCQGKLANVSCAELSAKS